MCNSNGRRRCPICNSDLNLYLRNCRDPVTGDLFEIKRCVQCHLGVTCPPPQKLDRYYSEYHGNRHGRTAGYCTARRFSILSRVCGAANGRRLLDVGCGDGSFLIRARQHGWKVFGTEMNLELARNAGLEVFASAKECESQGPFDCITLWHSLEHLDNPVQALLELKHLLRTGGHLIFAVPDAGGLQASIFGRHWFHLDTPRHLYHFGQESAQRLLDRTGFRPLSWWHQEFEYDLMGWAQSALNALQFPQNIFFHTVLKLKIQPHKLVAFAAYVCGIAACALALPLVPASTIVGRGGTLIVGAKSE